MAKGLNRGEVRLVRMPRPDKERPSLILTQQEALGYLGWVLVAPISSAIRSVPSEVVLGVEDGMKGPCAVNLYNLSAVRRDLVGRRLSVLSAEKMREVCAALAFATGCLG